MYVIDNIHAGHIEARDIPTLSAAVLAAAQYDGWGAEYARDAEGCMALRCSRQHIGNNPFIASGEEKPAYGITSAAEDDDDAIAEVAVRISATEWGGNMKGLRVLRQAAMLRERLQLALDEFDGDTGPGEWMPVEAIDDGREHDDCALLCYKWPEVDDPTVWDGDEPWKMWGGDAIIAAAGGRVRNGYGLDGIDHAVVELAL